MTFQPVLQQIGDFLLMLQADLDPILSFLLITTIIFLCLLPIFASLTSLKSVALSYLVSLYN